MTNKIHQASHDGVLQLGGNEIECAVLEDGTRVISERAFARAVGSKRGGSHWLRMKDSKDGAKLPVFLSANRLKPFISNELALALSKPIIYKGTKGGRAHGVRAELIPQILDVWLKARDDNKLLKTQEHFAVKADILMRGLAHVGIAALVDEATGYQEVRDREALQALLDKYLRKELAAWAKRFPDEFYQEMFRLKTWRWRGMSVNRPSVVGRYTNDIVYQRLAPGILQELEKRNPKDERGTRKGKHHQFLTENVGHPALAQHLHAVIALMRTCSTWDQFKRLLQRAFPKKGSTIDLPLDDLNVN